MTVTQVLILSDKSSGSSILQRELLKSSVVNAVDWTHHTEHETLYWVKAACLLGFPASSFAGGNQPFSKGQARRLLAELLHRNIPQFSDVDDDQSLITEGWKKLAAQFGPIFLEKSPHHLNQLPALQVMHEVLSRNGDLPKFVVLVRNPLAVCYSTMKRWRANPIDRQFKWLQSYANLDWLLRRIDGESFIKVRYEDLASNPIEELHRIRQFIGDESAETGTAVQANARDRWREDADFGMSLHPVVTSAAGQLGYTPRDLTNPNASSSYMFQETAGLKLGRLKQKFGLWRRTSGLFHVEQK